MLISSIAVDLCSIIIKSMTPPPVISKDKLSLVKDLYLNKKLCIREVAQRLAVSPDAVENFIRRHKIPKRSRKEAQQAKYYNKPLSFNKQKLNSVYLRELAIIGAMLYWAEGYKGDESNGTVDFANSDPLMIEIFLKFLRLLYKPDERRLRVYLYCYSNQNIPKLIQFWSVLTGIPKKQFLKPYVRTDFREDGRKMEYGMIHIRYHDKKLLLEIKNWFFDFLILLHSPKESGA